MLGTQFFTVAHLACRQHRVEAQMLYVKMVMFHACSAWVYRTLHAFTQWKISTFIFKRLWDGIRYACEKYIHGIAVNGQLHFNMQITDIPIYMKHISYFFIQPNSQMNWRNSVSHGCSMEAFIHYPPSTNAWAIYMNYEQTWQPIFKCNFSIRFAFRLQ